MILFSDGSDLVGVEKTDDIKYLRIIRNILIVVPGWPGYMLGRSNHPIYSSSVFKVLIVMFQLVYLIGGALYIKINFGKISFFKMGQNYITVAMTVVCVYRTMLVWTDNHYELFRKFLNEIHLFTYRNQSDYHMKMHLRIHKMSHFYIVYLIGLMLLGEFLFQVIPLMNTVNSGGFQRPTPENVTYDLAIYIALPFEYEHDFSGFMVVHIVNWIECYLASNYFCIIDAFLALLMFQLWGHLKILVYNLENFPRPAPKAGSEGCERFSREELVVVRQKIKEIVEHHNLILKYIDEVSITYGLSIALSYSFYQVSGCVLLLECSQMDPKALMRYGPLTLILLQLLIQMSVIFDLIGSQTDRLVKAAYFLPWECMDTSNRQSVGIILKQVQRPMGLKAMGMVEVGCRTMATILKTTMSYFVMLRTMKGKVKMLLFSDGSDLRGITRTQDIKYMKYLRGTLSIIAAWPGYVIGESKGIGVGYKVYMDVIALVSLVCEALYVRQNVGKISFFELGQTYITTSMAVMCAYRTLAIWRENYSEIFKKFITVIHLFNHRNKSAYAMKIHLYVHKMCHFFTIYMIAVMVWGIILYNIIPLSNTIAAGGFQWPPPDNVTYDVSIFLTLPFDYQHSLIGYIVVFIFDWYECYLASSFFCIVDLYLALMMFHLWGHLKILVHNLEHFPRPAPRPDNMTQSIELCERFTDEEMQIVRQKLKEIVDHHNLILNYTDEVSETFGLSIALSYAFHQVSGCVLLLECSQMEPKALMRYGPLTLILLQLLAQMSVIFELISTMTDRLVNATYDLPWEFMDSSNRMTVLIILRQIQNPLGLKAVGMVEVGCRTMATILKTSISYFVMLRTMTMME
ncbi:uncharacterized protein LOC128683189 [Plodia interpunctella]|uniref:uncharacterized protein LOC128683189 n=1 Tax=Plodia interpunctella TaxID=58824 RepID=UPI002367F399|nr:uncharacterized protein LOC128683189 [Plodia interpunctella]